MRLTNVRLLTDDIDRAVAYVRDPDGNLIELYEPTHEGVGGAGG